MNHMEIRFLTQDDDLLAVSHVYEQSWKYAYKGIIPQAYLDSIPAGRWAAGIAAGGMRSLCAIHNGQVIGTAAICKSRWAEYPDCGEIVSVYLLPAYMGKGYGRALLRRCAAELRAMGFRRILLWVLEENMRARRFYENNGFASAEVYRNDTIGGRDLREVMYLMKCEEHT